MMTIVQKHPGDFDIDGGKRNGRNNYATATSNNDQRFSKEKRKWSVCVCAT